MSVRAYLVENWMEEAISLSIIRLAGSTCFINGFEVKTTSGPAFIDLGDIFNVDSELLKEVLKLFKRFSLKTKVFGSTVGYRAPGEYAHKSAVMSVRMFFYAGKLDYYDINATSSNIKDLRALLMTFLAGEISPIKSWLSEQIEENPEPESVDDLDAKIKELAKELMALKVQRWVRNGGF